eukprot:TRINITY_DN20177_c0_g1_i1.p1 TRINITY_DN20177_c0_g1~~TRINITY_DN20177_c0_g1_i1.p1  ORF type:complete len:369 (+),score=61.70 TRINITY_DN20177_c0_g1_i1:96-1202(+)
MEVAVLSQIMVSEDSPAMIKKLVRTLCGCDDAFMCFDIASVLRVKLQDATLKDMCNYILPECNKQTRGAIDALLLLDKSFEGGDPLEEPLSETCYNSLHQIVNSEINSDVSCLLQHLAVSVSRWVHPTPLMSITPSSPHIIKRRWLQTSVSILQNPPTEQSKLDLISNLSTLLKKVTPNKSKGLVNQISSYIEGGCDEALLGDEESVYFKANVSVIICECLVKADKKMLPRWLSERSEHTDREDFVSAALGTDDTLVLLLLFSLKSCGSASELVRQLFFTPRLLKSISTQLTLTSTTELLIDILSSSDLSPSLLSVILTVLKTVPASDAPYIVQLFADFHKKLRKAAVGIPFNVQPVIKRLAAWLPAD